MARQDQRNRHFLWRPSLWIAAGLAFFILSHSADEGPRAPLLYADMPLYALMIAGLCFGQGQGFLIKLPRRAAPFAFFGLSWLFGMVYEASLTVDGSGVGGIHPDTFSSFILAQGDYILIALATLLAIRRWHLRFADVFFFAGGISLTEGLIFSGVLTATLASAAFYISPLMLAYYTLAYATFTALPLLLLDPETLWAPQAWQRPRGIPALWLSGAAMAFVVRIIWGLGWAPFATWLFDLPPNLPGM